MPIPFQEVCMTIKEIAELCGVSGETVRRWIHSIADPTQNVEGDPGQNAQGLSDDPAKNWQGLAEKLAEAEKSGKDPADFTLEETLAIIGEGGGNKALASLLADNAVTKNALTIQNVAMAKLGEQLEMLKSLPEQFEKFKGYAVEAYKKLEARVDGAYKEVLDNAVENAAAEVKEYLIAEHKPSAHEAQLGELKRYLSLTITATGDKRDKIDLFRLYGSYEAKVANPLPKDAFALYVGILYPEIKFKGGIFYSCRLDY
jgi:predicted transcriptional regulator